MNLKIWLVFSNSRIHIRHRIRQVFVHKGHGCSGLECVQQTVKSGYSFGHGLTLVLINTGHLLSLTRQL